MRRIFAKRPSSGTLIGWVALSVALGGVATAQTSPRATEAQTEPTTTTAQGTPPPTTTTPSAPADSVPVAEALHALQADHADNADQANKAAIEHVEYVVKQREIPDDARDLKVQAHCPEGLKVIGGGLTSTGGEPDNDHELGISGPRDESTWIARVDVDSGDAGDEIRVTAICAKVESTNTDLDKG